MSFTGKRQIFLESTVANNGFFPELSLGAFQKIYRVPAELAQESVEHQLKLARNLINEKLVEGQASWMLQGHVSLSAVDAANNSDLTTYYFSAVYLKAKAELLTDFQTFTRRDHAKEIAEDLDNVEQRLLADSDIAVRRLKGIRANITVELL